MGKEMRKNFSKAIENKGHVGIAVKSSKP